MTDKYEPIRILTNVIVIGNSKEELLKLYPNLNKIEIESYATGTLMGTYAIGKVIDAPTKDERIFLLSDKIHGGRRVAIAIPQHKDGYDMPNSSIARSRKGSAAGISKWKIEQGRQRLIKEQARIKKEKEKESRRAAKETNKAAKPEKKAVTTKNINSKKTDEVDKKSKSKGGDN